MSDVPARPLRVLSLVFAVVLPGLAASGCSDASGVGRTLPVSGKLTLNGEPVTAKTTVVLFKPDASRGNASPFEPAGTVDESGTYTLTTKGKKGAPPGWYKVTVTAREEAPTEHPKTPGHRPVARSLLPARYGLAETWGCPSKLSRIPSPAPTT